MYNIMRSRIRSLYSSFDDLCSQARFLSHSDLSPTVVMYHSISEDADRQWGPWQYAVTPTAFAQQIRDITNESTVISMDSLVNWLITGESIPNNAVVITFDDAYCDFYTEALPVLKKYDAPATVYVPTGLLNQTPRAPFEYRLAESILTVDTVTIDTADLSLDMCLETRTEMINCYNTIRRATKFSSIEYRNKILKSFPTTNVGNDILLSWNQVREVQQHPLVTIGSHGHDHIPLSMLSTEEQSVAIQLSSDILAEKTHTRPVHFSYPYGSFDESSLRAVRNTEFESAVTTHSRRVAPRDWRNPLTIPRIDAASELPF